MTTTGKVQRRVLRLQEEARAARWLRSRRRLSCTQSAAGGWPACQGRAR
jgi:hypothetical protein